jgi:hypothetical protein
MTGESRTTETKERSNDGGRDEVEPGELGDDGELDGEEVDEVEATEEHDGDERGTEADDAEDEAISNAITGCNARAAMITLAEPDLAQRPETAGQMAQPVTVHGIACMHAIDVNPGREIVARLTQWIDTALRRRRCSGRSRTRRGVMTY